MQREELFLKNVDITDAERELERVLRDIDSGKYDAELSSEGISRDTRTSLAKNTTLETPHGIAPDVWYPFAVVIAPAVTYAAKTVWDKIVIPKLKQVFGVDRVSRHHPKKNL